MGLYSREDRDLNLLMEQPARRVGRRSFLQVAGLLAAAGAAGYAGGTVAGWADDNPSGATGAEYLRAKAHRSEAARLLHEPLAFLARESVVQPGPELLRAAYLVDREAVDGFVGLVRRLQETHDGIRVLCTGPWPPYSFAQP